MSVLTNPADAAPAAAAAYVAAVLEALGKREPEEVLKETPRVIRAAIRDAAPPALLRPEGAGRWSVGQVIAHLADSELVWAWRMRCVLSADRPVLAGYDQDAWAERLLYSDVPPEEGLNAFEGTRRSNLSLLGRVPERELDRAAVHAERGEESLRHMIRLYAGHDIVHVAQIRRILEHDFG